MAKQPLTLYSNVISLRTTASELVFEFGTFFPEPGEEQTANPPEGAKPEIRVVMPVGALKFLADALTQASVGQKSASSKSEAGSNEQGTPSAKAQ